MGKASSSKKVARAARAGGRRGAGAPRQRDVLFPGVIGVIVVVGIALVTFSAHSRKSASEIPPIVNQDHWHAAYGINICGKFQPNIPQFESNIGIHTHGDGVIHIHPFSAGGSGKNATLGHFLDQTDVKLTNDSLKINGKTYKVGKNQCDGKDAELVVAQWKDVQNTKSKPALIRQDFNSVRFLATGEGYTIAFVKKGTTDIPKPPSAADLAALGSADAGAQATSTTAGANQSQSTTTAPANTTTTAPAKTATSKPGG